MWTTPMITWHSWLSTSPCGLKSQLAVMTSLATLTSLKKYNIGVATGEHCHNCIMFKQLIEAGTMDFYQIDSWACWLGGINEVIAVILLAALHLVVFQGHIYASSTLENQIVDRSLQTTYTNTWCLPSLSRVEGTSSRGSRLPPDKGSINAAVQIPRWTSLEELRLPGTCII